MKSEADILLMAFSVRDEIITKHPQFAESLKRIRFECSNRMIRRAAHAIHVTQCIALSVPFFADDTNFNQSLRNTVTHEIAHLLAPSFREYPGQRRNPHGPKWQAMHRLLGGDGERCHTMQVADAFQAKLRKKHLVPCQVCFKMVRLGPTQLRRHYENISKGGKGYVHTTCL